MPWPCPKPKPVSAIVEEVGPITPFPLAAGTWAPSGPAVATVWARPAVVTTATTKKTVLAPRAGRWTILGNNASPCRYKAPVPAQSSFILISRLARRKIKERFPQETMATMETEDSFPPEAISYGADPKARTCPPASASQ